jgi:hypothetical protein
MGLRFQRREPDSVVSHPTGRRWQHLVAQPYQQPVRRLEGAGIDDEAILGWPSNFARKMGLFGTRAI